MDFRQTACFVAVAEELHFGRAAARLNLSQPPLSQQIKGLEERLGVRLFDRNRRGVRLTAAGEVYLRYARQILSLAESGADAARRAGLGEAGDLRVGYSASALYSDPVLVAIARHRHRHPAVNIRLVEHTTDQCVHALEAGRIDLALVRGPLPDLARNWPDERRTVVSREGLAVVFPPDHPLALADGALGTGLSLHELRGERFVILARRLGTALNSLLDELFAAAGVQPRIAVETAEMASLLGLVEAGTGVAIVPAAVARQRGARFESERFEGQRFGDGRLVALPLREPGAEMDLFVLWPPKPLPIAHRLGAAVAAAFQG
ncbi:LysR family transcriptional regulator [Azospirillum griseum]|uniref:LysR family transcriptional regulator n=1 Tax=Azospirillum griseum TaxID=2496639 RepID=A0A431VCZ2_9PROT|nr:LysR substrate-binding domain-containing protein [Azospirillum griseum]RTR16762.1 LysR family transcriptional regulator [Azospirillum griseum]